MQNIAKTNSNNPFVISNTRGIQIQTAINFPLCSSLFQP